MLKTPKLEIHRDDQLAQTTMILHPSPSVNHYVIIAICIFGLAIYLPVGYLLYCISDMAPMMGRVTVFLMWVVYLYTFCYGLTQGARWFRKTTLTIRDDTPDIVNIKANDKKDYAIPLKFISCIKIIAQPHRKINRSGLMLFLSDELRDLPEEQNKQREKLPQKLQFYSHTITRGKPSKVSPKCQAYAESLSESASAISQFLSVSIQHEVFDHS